VLTVQGLAGPEDEFKSVVEANKLRGLRFEEIWSDEKLGQIADLSE